MIPNCTRAKHAKPCNCSTLINHRFSRVKNDAHIQRQHIDTYHMSGFTKLKSLQGFMLEQFTLSWRRSILHKFQDISFTFETLYSMTRTLILKIQYSHVGKLNDLNIITIFNIKNHHIYGNLRNSKSCI